jgi:hypothetical protein
MPSAATDPRETASVTIPLSPPTPAPVVDVVVEPARAEVVDREPAGTIPFAPRAVDLILVHLPESDQTAITRNWRPGDAARCRRCPTCHVNRHDTCTVVAPGLLDGESALLYRVPRRGE